jgi:hypothetical protein
MLKELLERNGLKGIRKNRDTLTIPLALERQLEVRVVKQKFKRKSLFRRTR